MTKKSDIKEFGAIFDLDGVLVDTSFYHKRAWFDLVEREGLDISDDIFRKTFGMQNYQIIPVLAKKSVLQEEIDRMSQWKERRYRELISGNLQLMEGVMELLDDLKRNNFALAIGTSTPRKNLDFMLTGSEIQHFFDAYVTSEDVNEGKPAPDTFITAAQKLSLSAEQCIVIEDALQGIEAGKKAAMKVIAVTTTRDEADLHKADVIVDSLAQLTADDFKELLQK